MAVAVNPDSTSTEGNELLDFEWDKEKAQSNERKHGVSFLEASEVFADALSLTVPDPDHFLGEARYLIFG